MKRCLITYEPLDGDGDYSVRGLKLLDRNLASLDPLGYTAAEQRQEALERAGKMSIQGVQLKLSAVLRVKAGAFDVVDRNGRFILKPPSLDFPLLPENETSRCASPPLSASRRRCMASSAPVTARLPISSGVLIG